MAKRSVPTCASAWFVARRVPALAPLQVAAGGGAHGERVHRSKIPSGKGKAVLRFITNWLDWFLTGSHRHLRPLEALITAFSGRRALSSRSSRGSLGSGQLIAITVGVAVGIAYIITKALEGNDRAGVVIGSAAVAMGSACRRIAAAHASVFKLLRPC